VDLHEGEEAVDLGVAGGEPGKDAAEPHRLLAELRPRPVLAGGRRIAFVEDGVDDLEDRGEALGALVAAWDFEGNLGLGQHAFRADDALGDRPFGDQEGARDLFRRQSADEAQG